MEPAMSVSEPAMLNPPVLRVSEPVSTTFAFAVVSTTDAPISVVPRSARELEPDTAPSATVLVLDVMFVGAPATTDPHAMEPASVTMLTAFEPLSTVVHAPVIAMPLEPVT